MERPAVKHGERHKVTDEPHANGRIRAEMMLDLDGKKIRSSEIIIYNAGQLYRDGEFIAVLQHELRHAIRLCPSNYIGSIMYPGIKLAHPTTLDETKYT